MRTEATHIASGTSLQTDAPTDNHGLGQSFSPTDLVATALGSCMMTIMGIRAAAHHLDLSGVTRHTTKYMKSDPRAIKEIAITFTFPATISLTDEWKQKLRQAAKTCPVAMSLHPDLKQTTTFVFE